MYLLQANCKDNFLKDWDLRKKIIILFHRFNKFLCFYDFPQFFFHWFQKIPLTNLFKNKTSTKNFLWNLSIYIIKNSFPLNLYKLLIFKEDKIINTCDWRTWKFHSNIKPVLTANNLFDLINKGWWCVDQGTCKLML